MLRREGYTLAATGDATISRRVLQFEGLSDRFDGLLEVLRSADTTVTNLETLFHDYQNPPGDTDGRTHKRAPPELLDELERMGFNLYSTASNHTFDYGQAGIYTMLEELEQRKLAFAGIGRNLFEARKPVYRDTAAGRVALLNASSSFSAESDAGVRTQAVDGRPGLSPYYVDLVYRVTEDLLEQLRTVSEALGFEARKADWEKRDLYTGHDWGDAQYFHFGDMKFEAVADPSEVGIGYEVDETNEREILEWIAEAEQNADVTIFSMHCHQAAGGYRNEETVPDFLIDFARQCIDAGADAFLSHGPHMLRGIERYEDKPIFYSLGNFMGQIETVERLSPKTYRMYGVDDYTKPSKAFNARFYDADGNPRSYLDDPRYWESVVPVCTFDRDFERPSIELYPINLQQDQPRPQRGTPVLAKGDHAESIIDRTRALSERFGTEIEFADGVGRVRT